MDDRDRDSAWAEVGNVAHSVVQSLKQSAQSGSAPKQNWQREIRPPDERLCPVCKGMKSLVYDVSYWDVLFSKIIPCPVCTKGEQEAYLDRICGLSDEMKAWRFDNTIRHKDNAAAYDGALALAQNPSWLFVMHGDNGVGKSRLLACLVNECRARGWVSLYYTTAQVLDHLRSAYAPNAPESIDHMWDRLIGARVLALDEFDKWNPKPWAEEKFFELVDERYRNGAQCLTAFASNADIETGPGYVVSRMHDRRCQIHHLQGADIRRLRK